MAQSRFIAGAIKRPGALTAKAKAAGMSVYQFAVAHQHDSGVTGNEARFYLNVLRKAKPSPIAKAAATKNAGGRVFDPDGIPNNGDEYRLVNGRKVPIR